ncbi:MAG: pilus assembly protein [Caulobacteraceae bacterium]|nr:pilus assembly protein [Caulobacteraceae bacterium]
MGGAPDKPIEAAKGSGLTARLRLAVRRLGDFVEDRRANVYITFAIVAPLLLVLIGAGIDYSYAENSKRMLQDATDAATLAVSAAVAKNPNTTVAALQTIAQTVLNADYAGTSPTLVDFHVCAPVQNDCTTKAGATMKMNTVLVSTQGVAPCTLGALLPMVCTASNGTAQLLGAKTTTVIGFGANIQLNIVMDSSASMIVGATANDVSLISAWMAYSTTTTTPIYTTQCTGSGKNKVCTQVQTGSTTTVDYPNWNATIPGDPGPAFANDNPNCAFACHDVGSSTTGTDIQTGLTNAHTAGATTRFDVMVSAAQKLINHVQTEANTTSTLAVNNYLFNVYSFDTTLHTWGSSNMSYSAALTAVTSVTPGLDTYIDNAMSSLITTVGSNGNGTTAASPEKFVILVTDGLQSDRNNNWGCSTWLNSTAWGTLYSDKGALQTQCKPGTGYASPMNTANCTTMKNKGIVVGVLETPYVSLSGSDQHVMPYERTVQPTIYPNGPNTASTVSAALQACATSGYYFQATNPSDIATGFITLTDKFLSQMSYITK